MHTTVILHAPSGLILQRLAAGLHAAGLELTARRDGGLAISEAPVHPERHGNAHFAPAPHHGARR